MGAGEGLRERRRGAALNNKFCFNLLFGRFYHMTSTETALMGCASTSFLLWHSDTSAD